VLYLIVLHKTRKYLGAKGWVRDRGKCLKERRLKSVRLPGEQLGVRILLILIILQGSCGMSPYLLVTI
jgi:hypothetical protein